MALSDELEALAKRHGALSYRNRADTQNPAFGFSEAGLESLLAEVRKRDEALIRQLVAALEGYRRNHNDTQPCDAERAGRAWLEGTKLAAAPQQEAQEPVEWQSRTRPTWEGNTSPWSHWKPCTKEQAEDYWKTPLLNDWAYEARALYTAPQPSPAAQEGK